MLKKKHTLKFIIFFKNLGGGCRIMYIDKCYVIKCYCDIYLLSVSSVSDNKVNHLYSG